MKTNPTNGGAHAAGDRLRARLDKFRTRFNERYRRHLESTVIGMEMEADIEDLEKLVRELVPVPPAPTWKVALGFNTAWPVVDVLRRLADATEHLLRDHNCDAHGWEGVGMAVERARDIANNVEAIQRLEAVAVPPAPSGAPDLATIKARLDIYNEEVSCSWAQWEDARDRLCEDVDELVAEIERLRSAGGVAAPAPSAPQLEKEK